MQTLSILAVLIVLASIGNLTFAFLLWRRPEVPPLPENLTGLPDRLTRLEALYQQLVESVAAGFRDARGENLTSSNLLQNKVEDRLEAIRTELVSIKAEYVEQSGHLGASISTRLSSFASQTKDEMSEFREAIGQRIEGSSSALRTEVHGQLNDMQMSFTTHLADFSRHSSQADTALRETVHSELKSVAASFKQDSENLRATLESGFNGLRQAISDALNTSDQKQTSNGKDLQESVDRSFTRLSAQVRESLDSQGKQVAELSSKNDSSLSKLRDSVEQKLTSMSEANERKLEQMRETVDEKLHSTLEKRLADNFSMVTDQLGKVQNGLGEMKDLASNVGDLKKVLTNVKSRGGFAEVQLGAQLSNVLAPNQYKVNVRVKPETTESVEFAICLPGNNGEECLLPIDAKFPKEPWERLESARDAADAEEIKRASASFESAIRTEAKRISEKYINPPMTANFAIMYLATESLFAEVVRNPLLLDEVQTKYRISVAGPTTLMALLISFQMGFQTFAIQKKGAEVWNILAAAKVQFGKFGELMNRVEKNVGKVQQTLQDIGTRTRVINRTLSGVDTVAIESPGAAALLEMASQSLTGESDEQNISAEGASAGT